jgi:hypothetical protein
MKKIVVAAFLALPMAISAQDAQSAGGSAPARVTKIVRVQYGNPRVIAHLAASDAGVNYESDDSLRAIVLKGLPSAVDSVERTIHELDSPSSGIGARNVEVTVSVIGASNKPDLLPRNEIPDNLAGVVKQLRAIFPYQSYALFSSMLMRSREGAKSESQGLMQGLGGSASLPYPNPYTLVYDEANLSSVDGRPLVHLKNFRFFVKTPVPTGPAGSSSYTNSDVGLLTDVDLREGQKVVVGKANLQNSDAALFVVLSARLVE